MSSQSKLPKAKDENGCDLVIALHDVPDKKIQEFGSVGVSQDPNAKAARICCLCNQEQPLRTRHCHECERCVLTFDHHCVFVNNCIGEKNRPIFYVYLVLLTAQCLLATLLVEQEFRLDKLDYWLFIMFAAEMVYFTMVATFFVFHNYLMCKGMTTWEYFSEELMHTVRGQKTEWERFGRGCAYNLKMYWASAFIR